MFDIILIMIALGLGAAGGGGSSTQSASVAPDTAPTDNGLLSGTDEGTAEASAPAAGNYVAEPQVPSGKFTTATEIKPIMGATKGNWVAVREYDGNDLVYFTHLLSWRCGLVGVKYSINGGPVQNWPLAPCQVDTAQPNAIPTDAQIYAVHPLKSVERLDVEIIYDDLSRDSASFARNQVLMP
ncbi:hypothetical protein RXV86_02590 [Alisedimentitalea sp. MJ-SS2]|uniref:hypothetical protein n=1 Tax=Aliisedimentitalea sp. MJ-SS2 TaxID=3049795 RepID=UPI00290F386A|nr:hypothetical protein [Alisedimentitalea sp. MJ-SS2]MDU8926263.1 hypothetical protein [Alisedimentitalea sp. MJ-SS2]